MPMSPTRPTLNPGSANSRNGAPKRNASLALWRLARSFPFVFLVRHLVDAREAAIDVTRRSAAAFIFRAEFHPSYHACVEQPPNETTPIAHTNKNGMHFEFMIVTPIETESVAFHSRSEVLFTNMDAS